MQTVSGDAMRHKQNRKSATVGNPTAVQQRHVLSDTSNTGMYQSATDIAAAANYTHHSQKPRRGFYGGGGVIVVSSMEPLKKMQNYA